MKDAFRLRAPAAVFVAVLGFFVALIASHPHYEWDVLGYVGVANEWTGVEIPPLFVEHESEQLIDQALSESVYDELATVAPERAFYELTESSPYRVSVSRDPSAFAKQLAFYRGRVAYVAPIAGLAALGMSPIRASFLVSLAASILIAIVVLAWNARRAPPWIALSLTTAILFACAWFPTARLATPDALAAACLLLGAWLWVDHERRGFAVAAFVVAVLARNDAALFAIAFLLFAPTSHNGKGRRNRWAGIALCVLSAWVTSTLSHDYGTVLAHTFQGWLVDPSKAPEPSFSIWWGVLKSQLGELLSPPVYWIAAGVCLIGYGALRIERREWLALTLALVAALGIRFLLFPVLWPRLCIAYVALTGMLAVAALAPSRVRGAAKG